jgi:dihydrolipoamide dehydrogenase
VADGRDELGFLLLFSDGEVLTGACAVGPEAGEWLGQLNLAVSARVSLEELRAVVQPFLTFSEIVPRTLARL